ncbi:MULTISPECIES: hypothetical protein [Haloarcula]|uniref:hypothetical protein n=1 Tax=Haloarcula TaxID=2237 RepID=UPI001F49E0E3|nr:MULTISPECIES: hypothetical protein [Haloarcula]
MTDPIPGALLDSRMDRVLEALLTPRRRKVLFLIKRSEPRPVVDFLPRNASGSRTVEIALHHTDLPRLERMAYIDWDRDANEVAKGDRFNEIEPVLNLMDNHADELPADWEPCDS